MAKREPKAERTDDLRACDESAVRRRLLDALIGGRAPAFRAEMHRLGIAVSGDLIIRRVFGAWNDAARLCESGPDFRARARRETVAQLAPLARARAEVSLALEARRGAKVSAAQIADYVALQGGTVDDPASDEIASVARDLDALLARLGAVADALDGRSRPPSRLRLLANALAPTFLIASPSGTIKDFAAFIAAAAALVADAAPTESFVLSVAKQALARK